MDNFDPSRLECDTLYDSHCLKSIPKEDLQASANVCRKCGRQHLLLTHAAEYNFGTRTFIDIFVRCSIECDHYIRIRVRAPE